LEGTPTSVPCQVPAWLLENWKFRTDRVLRRLSRRVTQKALLAPREKVARTHSHVIYIKYNGIIPIIEAARNIFVSFLYCFCVI